LSKFKRVLKKILSLREKLIILERAAPHKVGRGQSPEALAKGDSQPIP